VVGRRGGKVLGMQPPQLYCYIHNKNASSVFHSVRVYITEVNKIRSFAALGLFCLMTHQINV
jgi:hypothetical protein